MGGAAEGRESGRKGDGGVPSSAPKALDQEGANDLAGWVWVPAGDGVAGDLEPWVVAGRGAATGRIYIYICMYVSGPEEPCPQSTSWTGVEGGVAPRRAPTRYIPPPNEMTHVKASLVVGGLRAPQATLRGARPCPGERTGGQHTEPLTGTTGPRGEDRRPSHMTGTTGPGGDGRPGPITGTTGLGVRRTPRL